MTDWRFGGPEAEARAFEQYLICKERGHSGSSGVTRGDGVTHWLCKYCHTYFWTEQVLHEEGAPRDPDEVD